MDVALKFPGRIAEVLAEEGALVASGNVLARIEATELEATLRTAKAKTRQARKQEIQALAPQRRQARSLGLSSKARTG